MVQTIFERTQDYDFMNTLPVKSIIAAVRENLPQVFNYLDSRIITSDLIQEALKTDIRTS